MGWNCGLVWLTVVFVICYGSLRFVGFVALLGLTLSAVPLLLQFSA
jgi:hypothetical protein